MNIWQKYMDNFSLYDLIIIAMMSAMGIAVKPIIVPLAHIITAAFDPRGSGGRRLLYVMVGHGLWNYR